jgi:hypothetical protein
MAKDKNSGKKIPHLIPECRHELPDAIEGGTGAKEMQFFFF